MVTRYDWLRRRRGVAAVALTVVVMSGQPMIDVGQQQRQLDVDDGRQPGGQVVVDCQQFLEVADFERLSSDIT